MSDQSLFRKSTQGLDNVLLNLKHSPLSVNLLIAGAACKCPSFLMVKVILMVLFQRRKTQQKISFSRGLRTSALVWVVPGEAQSKPLLIIHIWKMLSSTPPKQTSALMIWISDPIYTGYIKITTTRQSLTTPNICSVKVNKFALSGLVHMEIAHIPFHPNFFVGSRTGSKTFQIL